MQDLKNLSSKKRSPGFGLFNFGRRIRIIMPPNKRTAALLPLPKGKRREQLKYLLITTAILLALVPISALIFQKAVAAAKTSLSRLRVHPDRVTNEAQAAKPPISKFVVASSLLEEATGPANQLTAKTIEGHVLHYTVRGDLQKRVYDFMASNHVPYGVFVAIEPSSGRILGMTSYSSVDPNWSKSAYFNLYPMASLFKIITASAALENRKISPETVIEFRGNSYSENPRYWEARPKGKNNRMDVTTAMGKSINPVYGLLACEVAGKASVMECANRFGFNQALLPGTSAKESKASEPQNDHGLMLMGAGLDHEVKISPLHAAVMMAAIANRGKMMAPGLTDKITDSNDGSTELFTPQEMRKLVSPETATALTRMLSSSVTSGTSRRAFHDKRGRPRLNVEIAAKTGSINGSDPRGHYSWFAAFAPANNPRIALVALVINQDKWKIKSAQVGEQALEEFFNK